MFIQWLFSQTWFLGILIVLGIIAIVFLLRFLFQNYEWTKYVFSALIILCVVSFTVFCGVKIDKYYSASGGIFGIIRNQFVKPEMDVGISNTSIDFNFKNLVFKKIYEDENIYSINFHDEDDLFNLDTSKEYLVTINETPVEVERFNNSLTLKFKNVFFNENNKSKFEDTLKINLIFYSNYTGVEISIESGVKGYGYWTDYFGKENLNIHIESVDFLYEGREIEQFEFCVITLYVNDVSREIFVPLGSDFKLSAPNLADNLLFLGWKTDFGEYVSELKNINRSVTLYADIIDTTTNYVVNFYVYVGGSYIFETFKTYHYGDVLDYVPKNLGDGNRVVWCSEPPLTSSGTVPVGTSIVNKCTGNMTVYAFYVMSSEQSY